MPDQRLRFYTSEQLGPSQSLTPEGFLLCQNVPIARTGTMLYAQGEVPVNADRDGVIRIRREPDEVFSPMSIASFEGKPVTNDHPPEKVNPTTWRNYAIGVTLNPRRGDGYQFDNEFLYADLLITDEQAIKDVRQDGKREVSAGYDAEYEELGPGEGRQHLIVGNHVALVDKGRCGPLCFIGDKDMANRRRVSVGDTILSGSRDRIMRAFRAGDADTLVDELDKVGTMLGDILSGANNSGGFENANAETRYAGGTQDFDAGGTHIHIHGGSGADEADDKPDAGTTGAAAGGAAGAAAGGAAAGGGDNGAGTSLDELAERVEALERAVAILAQQSEGDDDGDDNGDDNGNGDEEEDGSGTAASAGRRPGGDRSVFDEEASAPPTDKVDGQGEDNPTGPTKDGRRATVGDSTSLRVNWQELLSRAELLAPGIRMPTFDAKRAARDTHERMCKFRRHTLDEAMKEDDTKQVIQRMYGRNPKLGQMTCDAVTMLFNGASEMVRQQRGGAAFGGGGRAHTGDVRGLTGNAALQSTVAEINRKNRERYKIG